MTFVLDHGRWSRGPVLDASGNPIELRCVECCRYADGMMDGRMLCETCVTKDLGYNPRTTHITWPPR